MRNELNEYTLHDITSLKL